MTTSIGPEGTAETTSTQDRASDAASAAAATGMLICYMREGGNWRPIPADEVPDLAEQGDTFLAALPFPDERSMLLAGVRHLSPTHRHRFRMPVRIAMAGGEPWPVTLDTLSGMLADEFAEPDEVSDDPTAPGTRGPDPTFQLARIRQSVAAVSSFLRARENEIVALWSAEPMTFIASEQASLLGDIAQPAPKSRWELTPEHLEAYAPERGASFALRWLAVDPALVEHDSAAQTSAPQLTEQLLRDDAATDGAALDAALEGLGERVLLPVHPWQFERLQDDRAFTKLRDDGLVADLGELGSPVTATASLNTVYREDWPWQLTFPLSAHLSNDAQPAGTQELERGVTAARQLDGDVGRQAAQIAPQLVLLRAPAYLSVRRDGEPIEGLGVQLRENRWRSGTDAAGADVSSAGTLAQDHPYGGASRLAQIVRGLAAAGGGSEEEVARAWFGRYLDVVIAPQMRLHLEVGLEIDADQQLMLLELDGGWPARGVLRDGHGYLEPGADAAAAVEALVPLGIINALGVAGFVDERVLLGDLRDLLERERERGGRYPTTLLDRVLDDAMWRVQSTLRRGLEQDDDLFVMVPNPLHGLAR